MDNDERARTCQPLIVLVAEDEALVRLFAVDLLEEAGFEVIEAHNTAEALAHLEAHANVRAVFTDIEMPPGQNGITLAQAVAERWPHIAVLIGSGRVRPDPHELPRGAQFMAKPYKPDHLIATLRGMVKQPG